MESENIKKFVDWYFEKNAVNKSNYFKGDRIIFLNKLEQIGEKFAENYEFDPFEIDLKNLSEEFVLKIKSKLESKNDEFHNFNKAFGNGIPKALLGKNNYQLFLNELLLEHSGDSQEESKFFLRKEFILYLINEENFSVGSANSYASYVSSSNKNVIKVDSNLDFFGKIKYYYEISSEFNLEDLTDMAIYLVSKKADKSNRNKYLSGLREYKNFLMNIFCNGYEFAQYIPESHALEIANEVNEDMLEDLVFFDDEKIFEIDKDSIFSNFKFRLITQDRLSGAVFYPIRLLKKIFYNNNRKKFFDDFIQYQIENVKVFTSKNGKYVVLNDIKNLEINLNFNVYYGIEDEGYYFQFPVYTELGEEGEFDNFGVKKFRDIAIDHIIPMKDILIEHKDKLKGLSSLTEILKERGIDKSGKESIKKLGIIGNELIEEEIFTEEFLNLIQQDLEFLAPKFELQLMSASENLKKKNR